MTAPGHEGNMLAGVEPDDMMTADRPPHPLIESDRVEGTTVYNRAGEKIGTVKRFLVEKRSGKAQYAEMAFGGFLGIGKDIHPLPWEMLDYDRHKGGYVVDLTDDQLRNAPRFEDADHPPIDQVYGAHIRGYYGLPPI
ncbi:PRC-barrel domain-containing protein [Sphingobium phenoxybenzoativorans]